jgi:hypothetical protein
MADMVSPPSDVPAQEAEAAARARAVREQELARR